MRTIFITVLMIIFAGQELTAQTITKIYGFWHINRMGNIPKLPVPEEGGEANGNNKIPPHVEPSKSYYIYFESSQAKAPVIKSVVVNGRKYKTTVLKLQQLPAVYEYNDGIGSKKITLIPKGRKNVFVIALAEPTGAVKAKTGNEVAIETLELRKTKTTYLKKMKELPSSVVP